MRGAFESWTGMIGHEIKLIAFVGVLGVALYYGIQEYGPAASQSTEQAAAGARGGPGGGGGFRRPPPLVEVAQAEVGEVDQIMEAVGTTRARKSIDLASLQEGRVEDVHFDSGDRVNGGQLLVELDKTSQEAALRNAVATLREAQQNLQRTRTLVERGTLALSALETDEAEVERAQADYDQALKELDERTIEAPFPGIIGFRQVEPGARLDTSTVIAQLDDLSEIELDVRLPEMVYGQVARGQLGRARSAAFPERVFEGEVTLIGSRVDAVSRSFTIRLAIPNEDYSLPAGMFMTVSLVLETRDSVLVPEEAVVPEAGTTYIYVVTDGVVERRAVEVGIRRNAKAEILSGVEAGEQVVTRGVQKVGDGRPVRVLGEDAPQGAGQRGGQNAGQGGRPQGTNSGPENGQTGAGRPVPTSNAGQESTDQQVARRSEQSSNE